jgi:hypothetical protein
LAIPKVVLIGAVVLFSGIAGLALVKKNKTASPAKEAVTKEKNTSSVSLKTTAPVSQEPLRDFTPSPSQKTPVDIDLPSIDRIFQLFTTTGATLPIVETVEYSSAVSWLKGRPAWVADYAVYYNTSKHFIARSLNGAADYFSQQIRSGSKFNVFKKDKKIEFHLVVDVSRLKLAFYYYDYGTNERVLLKTYLIGLGRLDPSKASGTLTPMGSYSLGDKVAVYKEGITGFFHDQKTEMIRVFGTRWIPFDQEVGGSFESAKGYGINGAPWIVDPKSGKLVENRDVIGRFDSDGCIRMYLEDIEELFSIVVTKPTFVHVVKSFQDIALPGTEVGTPSR